jgi:hypothetical protein
MAMGEDPWFWLLPTAPVFTINYQEKVWSKKDVVNMYRWNEFEEDPKSETPDLESEERKS